MRKIVFKSGKELEIDGITQSGKSLQISIKSSEKALFRAGYDEMMKRLCPDKIIFYGSVPDDCKGDIIRIKPFSDKFNVAEVAAW